MRPRCLTANWGWPLIQSACVLRAIGQYPSNAAAGAVTLVVAVLDCELVTAEGCMAAAARLASTLNAALGWKETVLAGTLAVVAGGCIAIELFTGSVNCGDALGMPAAWAICMLGICMVGLCGVGKLGVAPCALTGAIGAPGMPGSGGALAK